MEARTLISTQIFLYNNLIIDYISLKKTMFKIRVYFGL